MKANDLDHPKSVNSCSHLSQLAPDQNSHWAHPGSGNTIFESEAEHIVVMKSIYSLQLK